MTMITVTDDQAASLPKTNKQTNMITADNIYVQTVRCTKNKYLNWSEAAE